MISIKHSLIALLIAFLLLGCGAESQQDAFLFAISELPGLRLSLAANAPDAFSPASVNDAYAAHSGGLDVWLFASQEPLDHSFLAWLNAAHSLAFQTEEGRFWFVPVDKNEDMLSFVLDHHLERWLVEEQLADLWRKEGERLRNEAAFDEAVAAYQQAIALSPDDIDSYTGLGAALLGLGESEQALAPLLQALSLDPENYWAQRLLGNAYLNLQRYELAVAPLSRSYLLRPEHPRILIGVALSLGRSGMREQALQVLDEAALRIDDQDALADIRTLQEEFSGE